MVLFMLPKFVADPIYANAIGPLMDFLQYGINDYIPSPLLWKIAHTTNFQKFGTGFFCLYLMNYVFNTGDHLTSWIYLSLHGTYGMLWCLKEIVFPDPSWQRHVTLVDHLMAFGAVLGPYWYFPYSIMSKRTDASMQLIALCISMHTLGCVLMMASDTQKYFVLKVKKSLIDDGWFGVCRNTNYLGEMMIYGSYAALTQDWISWAILVYVWTLLFGRNMFNKEASIARKKGGKEYMDNSWMIIPKPWGWMGEKRD
ncbi:hypothetical protein TrST_g6481 [Triparma strigata]|uniref:3-oxo-5-alpha-steroid 4-dehydrogenase C-terminal domain-containing protein n=1 Tax=Triparma strigata TaxID=1606541 RepID=A0A9W7BGK6_9STRA|nr:hypothetical protein TrST_g6481 [Triparma strigata]